MKQIFRVGVLASSTSFSEWEAEAIQCLLEVPGVELGLLVLEGRRRIAPPARPVGLVRRMWQSLKDGTARAKLLDRLNWFSRKTLYGRYRQWQKVRGRVPAEREVDLIPLFESVPRIVCDTLAKGRFAEIFLAQDVSTIRSHQLDILLKFGFNIIHGEVLEAARYGVWSYHHDDHLKYRGGPPGFWEVVSGDPWTGAMLQKINEKLDDGLVLHKEHFRTSLDSYSHNLHRVWRGSAIWPALVCMRIQAHSSLVAEASPKSQAPIYRVPTNGQMLQFFVKAGARKILSRFRPKRGLNEYWGIGHFAASPDAVLTGELEAPIRWLVSEPGTFAADPFVVRNNEVDYLFFEQYDYASRLGSIAVTSTKDWERFFPVELVLQNRDRHYSYPCVFRGPDGYYAVPEQSGENEVALYHVSEFPSGWKKASVLLRNFPGIDPTVFFHEGHWWMFVGGNETKVDRVYAYYAKDLHGPWIAHAQNPIIVSCGRRSRPGGRVFQTDQGLFRPAQYGYRYYGFGLLLYRIDTLNPREYQESLWTIKTPSPSEPFPDGMHHLDLCGGRAVIDGKIHLGGSPRDYRLRHPNITQLSS